MTDTTVSAPSKSSGGRGRQISAWVLVIIAGILLPISLIARWGITTLTDTEKFIGVVAPLADDPTVRQAVSTELTSAITAQVNVSSLITELLPGRPAVGAVLSPSLQALVDGAVAKAVDRVLASPRFSQLWVKVNTVAQQQLVAALSGDQTGSVQIQGDKVVLDTEVVFEAVKAELVANGLTIAANAQLPPKADREIVLLQSAQLQQIRTVYAFTNPVAMWLIFVVLVFFLIAVAVAKRRRPIVMGVGIAIVLGGIILWGALTLGYAAYQGTLAGTPFATAELVFWETFTVRLYALVPWVIGFGAIIVAAVPLVNYLGRRTEAIR